MSSYVRAYQKMGLRGLFEHLYMFRRIKEGTLVGTDKYGNKYYENTDLPYGQHRWYEPKTYAAQQLHDASSIPPEWHGWMHGTTDRLPTSNVPLPTGRPYVEVSDVPANLNTHVVPESVRNGEWRVNPTLNRERGYGVKNMYQSEVGGNGFYTQPGNLLSPVHTPHVHDIVKTLGERTYPRLKIQNGENLRLNEKL